jgi:SMP-30/gluconolaconase/LRE-like protein
MRNAFGTRRLTAFSVTLVLAALAGAVLLAATPTFWTISTQTDFLKGDVTDLSIDSDGRVFLGPSAAVVAETSAPFLWSIVAGADGTVWAGSGNEGKVLKVDKDGKITTVLDAAELEVHAVAAAPGGGVYAATSPDGKIYAITADGSSRTLFDPEDKYIWALAVDKSGNVFAATGDKGVIYKISADGKGTRFYKTNATNVVSLAFAHDGSLIAGTESPGRVFRIDASGKAFVLLDSPYREIHALRVTEDGSIYAAAVSATPTGGEERAPERPPTDTSRPPVASVSTEITAISVMESAVTASAGAQSTSSRAARRPGRGAIYRIRPDGLWDTLWETGEDAPYDLLVEPDGSVLVGTGTEGKIFRVSGNPARATLLARAAARQVTAFLRDHSGRIVGATSNPGKIFALSPSAARKGTYESDVRDAGTVASWGAIRWRAAGRTGQVQIFTRSGNTANPDETWSAWSKAYTQADGEQIASPNARYLQWRAVLSSDGSSSSSGASSHGPVLTSVTAAYLPRNLRPEVVSIAVHPPGTVFQRPFSTGEMEIAGFEDNTSDGRQPAQSTNSSSAGASASIPSAPALGRRVYQKGLQTFVWKAEDQNDDRLQFDVSYRREGETTWKVLKRGLWDPIFVWDTTSVPDGTYLLKVSASDAPSNSPGAALVGELESISFDVDNTAPRVEVQPSARAGARTTIAFIVRDDQSPVQRVEYSLDASRWRLVYPKDGIPDSRREDFEVTLDENEASRSVIIRATDAMNNVATAVAEVKK